MAPEIEAANMSCLVRKALSRDLSTELSRNQIQTCWLRRHFTLLEGPMPL